jgi:hypothetical protein
MGGAKRYPSFVLGEGDGFRRLNPSYALHSNAPRETTKCAVTLISNVISEVRTPDRRCIRYDANRTFSWIPGSRRHMGFVLQVASSPDRDELVTEIWWNDQMVAEVRRGSDGNRYIDLYPNPSRTPWSFRFEDWLAALKVAESR